MVCVCMCVLYVFVRALVRARVVCVWKTRKSLLLVLREAVCGMMMSERTCPEESVLPYLFPVQKVVCCVAVSRVSVSHRGLEEFQHADMSQQNVQLCRHAVKRQ